jgi:ribosome biogenesis protein ERB1
LIRFYSFKVYDLWGQSIFTDAADTTRGSIRGPPPLPAPKMKLPGHNESYNVSEEYILTEEEKQQWLSSHPEDREFNFLPQKYSCLRRVPAYKNLLLERFLNMNMFKNFL